MAGIRAEEVNRAARGASLRLDTRNWRPQSAGSRRCGRNRRYKHPMNGWRHTMVGNRKLLFLRIGIDESCPGYTFLEEL
jgi:hypothetical protein